MADRFTSVINVTALAAGASVAVAHNIVVGGVATAPQIVQPDRNSPIVVTSVTATNVNFTNNGVDAATAAWLCQYDISNQATPAQVAPGLYWQGGSGGAGPSPSGIATRIFYINNLITDSAAYAQAGIFSTDGAAMTWIEANVPAGLAVELVFCPCDPSTPHVMANGSTWGVTSFREVVYSGAGSYGAAVLNISSAVTLPAAAGSFPTLLFRGLQVDQTANLIMGANRQLTILDCNWISNGTATILSNDSFIALRRSTFVSVLFTGAGPGIGVFASFCRFQTSGTQIFADNCEYGADFDTCQWRVTATVALASPKIMRSSVSVVQANFVNTSLFFQQQTTVTACVLLDLVAASTLTCRGLTISPYLDGSATARLLSATSNFNTVPGPEGITTYPSTGSGQMILPGGARWLTKGVVTVTATGQTWNGITPYVVLDTSAIGAAGTWLLPAGTACPQGIGSQVVVKSDDGANAVTITPAGGNTIDGAATLVLPAAMASVTLTLTTSSTWLVS